MALTRPSDFTFKHIEQDDDPVYNTTLDWKTLMDSQPKELREYLIALLDEVDAQLATKTELANTVLGQITDNTLTEAKMANEMKKDIVGGVLSYNKFINLNRNLSMGGGI